MDSADVQLPHLETFTKAAELCSFTQAAQALNLTQAAVSQRIQALERVLDKSLFTRRGGRVVLTDAGRQLHAFAQQILDLHRQARVKITGCPIPIGGELVIAASSIPGEHLLPALLTDFQRQHPHIQVRASVSDSMSVIGEVEAGQVSLGLVGRKVDNPHLDFHLLARDRMLLVVPPRHPLVRQKKASLAEVAQHPFVLREGGSGLRHCFEKSLERAGRSLHDLHVVLELGSNEAIKEAVLQGAGVAVLSRYAVDKEIRSKQLHALEVTDLHCDRDMFIVQDRRRAQAAPARLFLTYLESHPAADLIS